MTAQTPPSDNGIYKHFPERRKPTEAEYLDALSRGMIVLDTNVLLHLYRYGPSRRDELLAFLEQHSGQLFIPHQVMSEFWKHRDGVISDIEKSNADWRGKLSKALDQSTQAINEWANRTGLGDETRVDLEERISGPFVELEEVIRAALPTHMTSLSLDTNQDDVLTRLNAILSGALGDPLPDAAYRLAIDEGVRRWTSEEPPGFGDRGKTGDDRAGDYLVWEQTLLEASTRAVPVIFVTDDHRKKDWWQEHKGKITGPRPELVREMHDRAGVQLFMARPSRLVPGLPNDPVPPSPSRPSPSISGHYLGLGESDGDITPHPTNDRFDKTATDGREQSSVDLRPVDVAGDDVLPEGFDDSAAGPASGTESPARDSAGTWTRQALDELLRRLTATAPAQGEALNHALKHDGFVPREAVYMYGGYGQERTLRGFTRPITRLCDDLRREGLLQDGAPEALKAVYDSEYSFVKAAGFVTPPGLEQLMG